MGTSLTAITVPSTVGGVSSGLQVGLYLQAVNRTLNFAGLSAGDTLDLEGANENTSAKYAQVLRISYSGASATEVTIPAENSQWYRVRRIAKGPNSAGTGSTVTVAGLSLLTATNTLLAADTFSAPATSAPAGLLGPTASTLTSSAAFSAFLAGGVAALAAQPRNVTFTTADNGASALNVPNTATILGTDVNNASLTEIVSGLNAGAGFYEGSFAFKTITRISFSASTAPDASTISIGFGSKLGLSKPVKTRANVPNVLEENINDTRNTGGNGMTSTFTTAAVGLPNGTYTPSTPPNGALNYAIVYEHS